MSEMVKLTMEVEVSKDELPLGYTGRLLWRTMEPGECALEDSMGVGVPATWKAEMGTTSRCPVVEVRQPWRVPDYLRDKRFNGWTLKRSVRDVLLVADKYGGMMTVCNNAPIQLHALGWNWSDFDGMKIDTSYALGEGAE